ncbi:recombinase family protein [Escherichia coli]|uniref:recombinase family protein n=1 Tax=Escherichia coli TaxID=562 RepID=UPI000BE90381|nr:recombinase family protein [Escherichia coli]MDC6932114.1 recombinase family protein [Escherichia coli]MDC7057267.1 recombinase family protein [Escherichia coli]MDC7080010.1 recombinase family protein [Escherichia coli]
METIGYCRVSTREQSIDNQKLQIEKFHKVDKWFVDEAVSGTTKATSRDGFIDMMNYVRSDDTLVVAAIDRLGRNTVDVLTNVETLQTKGVRVVSLREGFDLSSPIGKAMLTMMAGLADLEKDLISERRKAGIERAKAEGVHMGRPAKASPEAVQTLISQGKTRLQIQEELGISKATYYRLAK